MIQCGLHKKPWPNYLVKNIKTINKYLTDIFEYVELVKSEFTVNPNDSNNTGIVIINSYLKIQQILYNFMP